MNKEEEEVWREFGLDTRHIVYNIDMKLDDVYSKLVELTDGEEDKELHEYNEYLLDSIQEAIAYIHNLEKLNKRLLDRRESIKEIVANCDTCKHEAKNSCTLCGLDHVMSEWQVRENLI